MCATGYFWIFPISDRLVNVGVGGDVKDFKINPMTALKWFLKRMDMKMTNVVAAPCCLDGTIGGLVKNNLIKVGERGGLVNPITAEGIYLAMKSGKIAAECIINDNVQKYEALIKSEFKKEFDISKKTKLLLSLLPVPVARAVFKIGINHLKSNIEKGSLEMI